MTNVSKVMNPQHFGSELADIQIQIWINLEIRIGILDHVWLRLTEVCSLQAQSGC